MELEVVKKIINVDYPTKITNEWLDNIQKTDPKTWDNISRWGFCYKDMSKNDLSELDIDHLNKITFNSSTIWPDKSKMPVNFNPENLLTERKTPMIGINELHSKGITGKGVIVATIDSGFQGGNHEEFNGSKIKVINLEKNSENHFHAEGVLSNLCGQNLGIAPEVGCYHYNTFISQKGRDLSIYNALNDINNKLDKGVKIRAVNISGPLMLDNCEFKLKIKKIVDDIESKGCKIVDSNIFGKTFTNVEYGIESDIQNINDLKKAKWQKTVSDKVGFVCGGKVTPEFCSNNGYKYEQESCYSWTIPQAVGLYALCLQVNENLTWEEFEKISKKTSQVNDNGIRVASPAQIVRIAHKLNETSLSAQEYL